MTLDTLQQNIGKRVELTIFGEEVKSTGDFIKKHTVQGVLVYAGFNENMGHNQVTINRTPYTIDKWNQIKLVK